jgi:trimethylamine:corrinoid methyltransferase-like protein
VVVTNLAERRGWEEWEKSGWINMVERAQLNAGQLLCGHQLKPLHPGQDAELDDILHEAERYIYEELNPSH